MLEHLYYNGVDVTAQVRAGMFTAPALVGDNTLEAVFADAPPGITIYGRVTIQGAGE